jgi:hypothetical protein
VTDPITIDITKGGASTRREWLIHVFAPAPHCPEWTAYTPVHTPAMPMGKHYRGAVRVWAGTLDGAKRAAIRHFKGASAANPLPVSLVVTEVRFGSPVTVGRVYAIERWWRRGSRLLPYITDDTGRGLALDATTWEPTPMREDA